MKKLILFILLICVNDFANAQPVKRILLEEFTTAPCGFCPEGDLFAGQLIAAHPQVIWVAHHAGFGTDSMTIAASSAIAGAFTTGAPMACIDRGDYQIPVYTIPPYIAVSRQKWDSVCVAHLNDAPVVEVNISNNYDTTTRILNCTVDLNFITAPVAGDLRIHLFLAEETVTGIGTGYDQRNYFNTTVGSPFYGLGDWIPGYVHEHVMRAVPSGTWGLAGIIPNAPAAGSSYTYTFQNIPIPLNWKDNDIDVIAFVGYYNTNENQRQIINSNQLPLKNLATTGITDLKSKEDIKLFPNPSAGKVMLALPSSPGKNTQIIFTDLTGRVLKDIPIGESQINSLIDLSFLSDGIYLYRIISGNDLVDTGKIVLEK